VNGLSVFPFAAFISNPCVPGLVAELLAGASLQSPDRPNLRGWICTCMIELEDITCHMWALACQS
jgi:hypothetical protein